MQDDRDRFSRAAAITAVLTLSCTIGALVPAALPAVSVCQGHASSSAWPLREPVGIVTVTSGRPIRSCRSSQTRA